MAGQLIELFSSRTEIVSDKPTAEFHYMAIGCADETEVRTLALDNANTPATYNGMYRRIVEIAERITNNTWKVVVRYELPSPDNQDTNQPVTSFDSTGGTQHITQSIATIGSYGPAASTLLGGAIGYDGESVNGVDITIPVWSWTETRYFSDSDVNMNAYYALTGCVNSDVFKGYQPGEVLFMGASGQKRGDPWIINPNNKWEVNFKFAASPNLTGLSVGTIIGSRPIQDRHDCVGRFDPGDTAPVNFEEKPFVVEPAVVLVVLRKFDHGIRHLARDGFR